MCKIRIENFSEEDLEELSAKQTFRRRPVVRGKGVSKQTLQGKAGGKHRREISWEDPEQEDVMQSFGQDWAD